MIRISKKPPFKIAIRPKAKVVISLKRRVLRKPTLFPCLHCNGRLGGAHSCWKCHGAGVVHPRVNFGVVPQSPITKVLKPLTILDLEFHGFAKTGIVSEPMSVPVVCRLLRKWLRAPSPLVPFKGEKAHLENEMARAGWWRQPITWAEACERYKTKVKIVEKKTKSPKALESPKPKMKIAIRGAKL